MKTIKSKIKSAGKIKNIDYDFKDGFYLQKFTELQDVYGTKAKLLTSGREGFVIKEIIIFRGQSGKTKTFRGTIIIGGWVYNNLYIGYSRGKIYVNWVLLNEGLRFSVSDPISLIKEISSVKKIRNLNVKYEEKAIILEN